MIRIVWLFLLFPLGLVGQSLHGFQVVGTVDNDFLGIKNKDEDYTAGAKLEIQIPGVNWKWIPFLRFKKDSTCSIHRLIFGGGAYTPRDIASKTVVVGDRPYASITCLTVGTVSYSLNSSFRGNISSDFMIGLIGAPGPGNVQAFLHENHVGGTNRPVPQGWHNQVGAHGSLVASYTIRAQGLIGRQRKDIGFDYKWIDPNWVAKVEIGNYMMNLQGGFRINLFNSGMTILQDYNPTWPTTKPAYEEKTKWYKFNLFVEPSIQYVIYNATLEGLMFNDQSAYIIPHNNINRLLLQASGGFNLILYDVFTLRYTMYIRSQEFTGGKANHSWGSVTIGLSPARWNKSGGRNF